MALFEDNKTTRIKGMSRFEGIKGLMTEFCMDSKADVKIRYFQRISAYLSGNPLVVGIYCMVSNPKESGLMDDLNGFLDIPASMQGFACEVVSKGRSTYAVVYDPNLIHRDCIRKTEFYSM